ncbi:TlpA family protein disulfide reductase [Aquimarina brevivitae]|uniref:Thiol-disulfide isomerase/thioredoxin n=1 Tax=Aquimarina brevivitae TaxID=323412 RepID=A0A4Q7P3I1_9FLAO|nr:TlpA disulfide reductase family protein [Aquimarina brevivitae]RZS93232.1 thiol-disulfide isomerase/thioredoxin [Aquimarina brevivitae]
MRILIVFSCFLLFACAQKEDRASSVTDVVISLHKKIEDGPFPASSRPLYVYDQQPIDIKGLPAIDTLKVQYYGFKTSKLYDSVQPKGIHLFSGFENDSIVISLDLNYNKDFSDDRKLYFSKEFLNNKNGREALRKYTTRLDTLQYKGFKNGHSALITLMYKVKLNDSSIVYRNDPIKTTLSLQMQTYDPWWSGETTIENEIYKLAYDPGSLFYPNFLFAKINDKFPTRAEYDYIDYKLKDTIQLGSSYFRMDSIDNQVSRLFLKKLAIKEKLTGYRRGETIKDIRFIDMNLKTNSLSQLLTQNEYVLIDFWGTWCAPCIKLTPDLVKLKTDFPDRVSIVSFAYDEERNKVASYIEQHDMNWTHVFIKGNAKGKNHPRVIKDLRIQTYPTFLLINKELKIIERGYGKESLHQIRELLLEQSEEQ